MPILGENEFAQTSFSCWYESFSDVTFNSKALPAPPSFIDYLRQDGVYLPKSSGGECELGEWKHDETNETDDYDDDINFDEPGSEIDDLSNLQNIPDFRDFQEKVENVVKQLGGEVFPKMNWSSPKDASWIAFGNTLKCKTSNEIFLLLKSSDFVLHDLEQRELRKVQEPFTLVLRQWYDIHPGSEFRCFVKHKNLIGICQRDRTTCYPFIVNAKEVYRRDICEFFKSRIQKNFPLDSYTFDVYRRNDGSYWIVDFNPFGPPTDGILFEWEELNHNLPDYTEGNHSASHLSQHHPNALLSTPDPRLNGPQSRLDIRPTDLQPNPELSQNGVESSGDQQVNGHGSTNINKQPGVPTCSHEESHLDENSRRHPNNPDLSHVPAPPSGPLGTGVAEVVFRCVERPPSLGPAEYRQYAYPADVARLVSGEGHAELVDLIRQATVRDAEELSDESANSN